MKKQTLLKKTQSIKFPGPNHKKKEITDEIIELALAWAKDKINSKQVMYALQTASNAGMYIILARALKMHFKRHN